MIAEKIAPIAERRGVRQFLKFCIVGASSFVIDFGICSALVYGAHLPMLESKTVSFCLAVTNGFIWNQRWTFRHRSVGAAHQQYAKFVGVNVVGLLLNWVLMSACMYLMTGRMNAVHPPKFAFVVSFVLATGVVTFWNFFANKHWTFKPEAMGPDLV